MPPFHQNRPMRYAPHSPRRYTVDEIRAAVLTTRSPTLEQIERDPTWALRARGVSPDPWQTAFLNSRATRQTVLACRRAGKTTVAATKTHRHCVTEPRSLALVFSPTIRQSVEFARSVLDLDETIGRPVARVRDTVTMVEWANGSRLMSLPDNQRGVVGFTPTLIVIDEAARVSDELYKSVRPMLALGAHLVATSTPFGQLGWFFDLWKDGNRLDRFDAYRVTADECPRITPEFLAEERQELGPRWFRQEWYCSFESAADAVFSGESIDGLFADDARFAPLEL